MGTDAGTDRSGSRRRGTRRSVGHVVDVVRARLAQVVWLVCVLAALVLAVGALLVALGADEGNDLVSFVLAGTDTVDLGVFSRDDGLTQFVGKDAGVRNALVNWGIGAIAWLVLGRVLDRLIRP